MAALIQSLVALLVKDEPRKAPYREIMLNNKWHASRYGLDGTFIEPKSGRHGTFADAALQLCENISVAATELGAHRYLGPIKRILSEGTSAHRQREILKSKGDFRPVIDQLRGEFWN